MTSRQGRILLQDATLHVQENGLPRSVDHAEREQWQKTFKQDVFARVVRHMKRLGWHCRVPKDYIAQYGWSFACGYRECSYGDLKGFLELSGCGIKLEMWQGVNTPTRADHGGRYESNKEKIMPYLIRLRMERTRRRLIKHLTTAFPGYSVEDQSPKAKRCGPGSRTAIQCVDEGIRSSGHYCAELGHARINSRRNETSADGETIHHGQRVYAQDWRGRMIVGTAYYNLNSSWYVVTGSYDYHVIQARDIYVNNPGDLRRKRNAEIRRSKLEGEMRDAAKRMDFRRAETVRQLLWPEDAELFMLLNEESGLYHRTNFRGYTKSPVDAGKFTYEEVKDWQTDINRIVPVASAA